MHYNCSCLPISLIDYELQLPHCETKQLIKGSWMKFERDDNVQ